MRDEYCRLFARLDPPSGGLEGLRKRMDREPARRLQLAACFLLLMATLGLATKLPFGGERLPLPEFEQARIRLGIGSQPSEPLTIPDSERLFTAARRIPLPTEEVVFYMVGSLDPPETKKQDL